MKGFVAGVLVGGLMGFAIGLFIVMAVNAPPRGIPFECNSRTPLSECG